MPLAPTAIKPCRTTKGKHVARHRRSTGEEPTMRRPVTAAAISLRLLMRMTFVAALTPFAAFGHHSAAPYDFTREVEFEGTVTKLEWQNPHILFTLETRGADGNATLQEIEVVPVSLARTWGLPREALAPGEHVVVKAWQGRSGPRARALGVDVTTDDGRIYPLNVQAGFSAREGYSFRPPVPAATVESFAGLARFLGSALPYTEAGRAARAQLTSTLLQPGVSVVGFCEPRPPLHLALIPDLRTIEVSESSIGISYEGEGLPQERVVHMDRTEHPADLAPALLGHSIGRWEDDALVIDTVGQAPHGVGSFIVPSTASTHLIERFELTEDRQQLEYTFTIEDPAYFTQPISYTAIWDHRPDLQPSAVPCDPDNARRAVGL
jgi:hypothetical protein